MNFINELKTSLVSNIRDYGMYLALAVITVVFTFRTGGLFISPNNIYNIIIQTGYIGVMAVGMTLVIVIRHIDLSIGSVLGFASAVSAILMLKTGINSVTALLIALAFGALAGTITGLLVARIGIPAFVASLAGMFIYRGMMFQVLSVNGGAAVRFKDPFIDAIGNGAIPRLFEIGPYAGSTVVIGVLLIVLFAYGRVKDRKIQQNYKFEVDSFALFMMKLLFVSIIILLFTLQMALGRGFPVTLAVVGLVIAIFHFVTTKTVLGRHIYAVGGNPEAAELSGIDVKKITIIVFAAMGLLAGLAGFMYAARLNSATLTAGRGLELFAIAGAFVGGVSAGGGIGKITGSIIGALVIMSLSNGMQMLGVATDTKDIVIGVVLVLAVVFDIYTRNLKH
ncbi:MULTISPECIES: sugar ABC transporter permease [unclassified Fusibacter]|uniref:sugar ABC transporter permease n=1 Tax=unclassified Fusibacter TaxID=2624464 RepID=UPI001010AFC5|nr:MULTISPECIES: sugar ABC transporter permease [unclassified Fusibacter]MCK8059660.1 sugar ABC transporter permease [Fusibacter sp. A2]NPE21461.1 sugar ABC transporter permease [Fusibacter sp. A1]RXV61872.1 sugar ABC transporter permease [Fusibacter sp. A1]